MTATQARHPAAGRLAIDGGTPVRSTPLAPWPSFAEDEVEAAAAVLRSGRVNYWTGPDCAAFEEAFAAHCGVQHAISLANGSLALELALIAAGIGPGDDVVTSPRTFIASASSAALRGAQPVFADVDADSQNITAETIRRALTPRTKAIVVVHLAGWPCDMDPIMALAAEHGLTVIEDCAQAHGATYKGRPVGSLGHYGAYSFCQDKIITTGGEGGMLVTNDAAGWARAWAFKDHGKSHAAVYGREHPPGFRWLHESFGSNWRMTGMQAAIGLRQLGKLPDWSARRRANAAQLNARLGALPALRTTVPPSDIRHAYYKYYAFLRPERLHPAWSAQRVRDAISAEGIPCMAGSCSEVYLERAFDRSPARPTEPLPVARALGETSLMFMVHPTLTDADMDDACTAVEKVLAVATRG